PRRRRRQRCARHPDVGVRGFPKRSEFLPAGRNHIARGRPSSGQIRAEQSLVQVQSPQRAVSLPAVDKVLNLPAVRALSARYGHAVVTRAVRSLLAEMRRTLLSGAPIPAADLEEPGLAQRLRNDLEAAARPKLRRVFNLTGTVLHTNLGRALLPDEAVEAVVRAMRYPCNVEFDLEGNTRGDRDEIVAGLLAELTGCEAATVVNNNAAA